MANTCFLHSYGVNHFSSILKEYCDGGKDFFEACDNVIVLYGGQYPIPLPEKCRIVKLDIEEEIRSMEFIKEYCRNNQNDKVCYIHTKGVTNDNVCITEWRNYMFHFCCEQYKQRLVDLDTYDTCGVDLRNTPVLHYSGNFWWSTSKHINSLCNPRDTFSPLSERHKAEFWICSGHGGKHLSLHDCGINVYERHLHRYPRERYIK